MLARIPARLLSRIGDMFESAEPPNDIALPIDLNQIRLILVTMVGVAEPRAAEDLPVRQQLVGKAPQTFPQSHFLSIHIDQQGAEICCRKNGVTAPRLGGILQSDAGRIDRWMSHLFSYSSNGQVKDLAHPLPTARAVVKQVGGRKSPAPGVCPS